MTVVDYPDFGTEAENARQISITGVPLNHLQGEIVLDVGGSLTPGNTATYTQTFKQISYDLHFDSFVSGAGTPGSFSVTLTFSDSVSGLVVGRRSFNVWPATAQGGATVVGSGPMRGDTLKVQVTSNSVTARQAYLLLITQHSRPRTTDRLAQEVSTTTASGNIIPPSDIPAGVLVAYFNNTAWTTGATLTVQCPLYFGLVQLYMNTSSGTTDAECQLQDSASAQGLGTNIVYDNFTNSHGLIIDQVNLSASQVKALLTNNNAATKSVRFALIEAEGP